MMSTLEFLNWKVTSHNNIVQYYFLYVMSTEVLTQFYGADISTSLVSIRKLAEKFRIMLLHTSINTILYNKFIL